MRFAVVTIGYNRPGCMNRLLHCLNTADYLGDKVNLVVSIDYSGFDGVQRTAESFNWKHGEKRIIAYKRRQGLRNHILYCGDLLTEYDAIAVFEDDVLPSLGFYSYMKQTVDKYYDDDCIAGISLYQHLWNVNANMPFQPALSDSDVYFMQFAQSWGQIWMKNQWFDFSRWYVENKDKPFCTHALPMNVNRWPETSWLKYHIKYCVENDRYFVYPYKALSTNCSEIGEHNNARSNRYQVPLLQNCVSNYRLPEFGPNCIIYDAFFERLLYRGRIGELDTKDIEFDLYGNKDTYQRRFVVSCKRLPYKRLSSYGLDYRPHEENVLTGVEGDSFFLYDTEIPDEECHRSESNSRFEYYYRTNDYRETHDYVLGNALLSFPRFVRQVATGRRQSAHTD